MLKTVELLSDSYTAVFGVNDQLSSLLEESLHVRLRTQDGTLVIEGEPTQTELAAQCVETLIRLAASRPIDPATCRMVLHYARENRLGDLDELMNRIVAVTAHGKPITCRTAGQLEYVNAVRRHELTIAEGPAGTGKTYLAVAMAVTALKNREVERLILTRPAVEAGERLGFLPGDMTQKIDPYLRPLYDALYELTGSDSTQRMLDRGILEIAPLAFMRGRTLSHAFVILDEAQNTTAEQMKMFLTRLGAGSRFVITGDATQVDLPGSQVSGLRQALEVLKDEPGISIVRLTAEDVVRHELVLRIIQAYERYQKR